MDRELDFFPRDERKWITQEKGESVEGVPL